MIASVPDVVTGLPVTFRSTGTVAATLLTVPPLEAVTHCGFAAAPCVERTWPDVPGASTDQAEAPR